MNYPFFLISRRQFLVNGIKTAVAALINRFVLTTPTSFVLSVWSGAITPASARVNARLALDSPAVRLVASPNPDLSNPIISDFYTADLNLNNRMVSLFITGLQPGTRYYYAIEADGVVDTAVLGQFQTPAVGPFSFTFAFASCARTGSNHAVFTTIHQHNPLFFIHMGDMHYQDIAVNDRNVFREAFNTVLAQPNQATLYRNVPIALYVGRS